MATADLCVVAVEAYGLAPFKCDTFFNSCES